MRVVGLNGIATNGEHSVDLLLAALAGLGVPTLDVNLPIRHWFSARWGGCPDGSLVARLTNDGDILACHSFGAVRAWHAHQVRDYRAIVCIAPAMSRQVQWRYPERVTCFWSPRDWVVRLGAKLIIHPFGAAGATGFDQAGVRNIETRAGHSDYFAEPWLSGVVSEIVRIAQGAEPPPAEAQPATAT